MKTLITKQRLKYMTYLLLPIIAGVAIVIQTALSGKSGARDGLIETVILIHFFGLVIALILYFIRGNANFSFASQINLIPVIAGAMGVIIVFTISKSFVVNGALTTIMLSVVIQLVVSTIIDNFGLFGVEKNPVNIAQIGALLLIVSGVVLLQYSK